MVVWPEHECATTQLRTATYATDLGCVSELWSEPNCQQPSRTRLSRCGRDAANGTVRVGRAHHRIAVPLVPSCIVVSAGCVPKPALHICPVPLQTRTLHHYARAAVVQATRRL